MTKAKEKNGDYVNEHILTCLMSMFKNYDGQAHQSIRFREDFKKYRPDFDLARQEYENCLANGLDKWNSKTQAAFKEMLNLSGKVYPTDAEISELYESIRLISNRCIRVYGKFHDIDADDVAASTFERWLKYRHNFDPLKISVISGTRVNAFAYMTQIIKNSIYENVNRNNRDKEIRDRLMENHALLESLEDNPSDNKPKSNIRLSELEEREIISLIVKESPNFTSVKKLISGVAEKFKDYSAAEVTEVILKNGLLSPLEDTMVTNKWKW